MGVSTADALAAAASCNTLLDAIDRLEVLIDELSNDAANRGWSLNRRKMMEWVTDARETVLDIKARL